MLPEETRASVAESTGNAMKNPPEGAQREVEVPTAGRVRTARESAARHPGISRAA